MHGRCDCCSRSRQSFLGCCFCGYLKLLGMRKRPRSASGGNLSPRASEAAKQLDLDKHRQVLLTKRNRLIAEAENARNLQIKNIHELFDFTLKDIDDQYQSELEDLNYQCNSSAESSSRLNGGGISRFQSKPGKISNGVFEKTLSEECVREDFVAIVRDLEDRALNFANQQKAPQPPSVTFADGKLSIKSQDCGEPFSCKELVLFQGSVVNLRSTSNDEEWLGGVIVVLGEDDLILRLHTGPRLRVPYSQLRDRRIVLSTPRAL